MVNRLPQRQDARQNRQRLIEAARDVFRERGVSADVREIAERAGLAVGTIYKHFPSKDDLILGLMDDAIEAFVAGASTEDAAPLERLERLLVLAIEMTAKNGWLIDAYLGRQLATRLHEAIDRKSAEFDFKGRCAALLAEAIEEGEVRPDINMRAVTDLLTGMTSPWIIQPRLVMETAEEMAAGTMKTLLDGIKPLQADQTD
jgi:AcrR family transcriptional regulator